MQVEAVTPKIEENVGKRKLLNGTRSDLQRYVNAITPTAKNDVNFIKFHFQAKVTKECYRVGKVKDKHQDYIRNGYGGGIKKPLVVHGGKIRELSARLLWTTSFLCRKQRKCE